VTTNFKLNDALLLINSISYISFGFGRSVKQLNYEVSGMKYKVILQESTEGFAVSVPGLPGCHSQGATEQEALENIGAAIAEYLDVVAELAHGKTVREVEVGVA